MVTCFSAPQKGDSEGATGEGRLLCEKGRLGAPSERAGGDAAARRGRGKTEHGLCLCRDRIFQLSLKGLGWLRQPDGFFLRV